MASCLKKTQTVLCISKALVCRGMFLLHGLICIWRVTVIKSDIVYWSLAGTIPLVILETVYTLRKKSNGEWKWICPSVFLYLGTSVPAIWFLELDVMRERTMMEDSIVSPDSDISNTTNEVLLLNGQFQIDITLGSEEWCKILEQLLLLILIIGRWLLPKGEITREQLSQLLLVYIGMSADIIELFEAFKEETVRQNRILNIAILSLWTGSLTQFTLVLTATKSKKRRTNSLMTDDVGSASCNSGIRGCCPTEVMSIVLSVFLQDAPFLVLRLLLIFRYDVLSYSNIFFTSKNSLVLMLQIYRLVVLFTDDSNKIDEKRKANTITSKDGLSYGSSLSNSISLTSDRSTSEDSNISETPRHGSEWTKLRKLQRQRCALVRQGANGSPIYHSESSVESETIPGSNCVKKKVYMHGAVNDESRSPQNKKSKTTKTSSLKRTSLGNPVDDHIICRYHDERTGKKKMGRRQPYPIPQNVEDGVKKNIEPQSSPHVTNSNVSENSDKGNQGNNLQQSQEKSSNFYYGKRNVSVNERRESKISDNNHLEDSLRSPYHKRLSLARKEHPSSIKDVKSVLTLLNDKGKFQTVFLKLAGDGTPIYLLDNDAFNTHNNHNIAA